MLKVSTVKLSADLSTADETFGTQDRGDLAPEELGQLLHRFSQLEEVQNHTHEPRVIVNCPQGEFSVRMSVGKLFLYNPHDLSQPPAELDIPGLMEVFTGSTATGLDLDGTGDNPVEPKTIWRGWLGVGLLVGGLGLNGWALYSYFQPQPVWPPPAEIKAVTDPGTLSRYPEQLAGTYATGSGAGQRTIVIAADQSIAFHLLGAGAPPTIIRESRDSYTLGRVGQKIHLVTPRFGAIEVQPDGSLLHAGDQYVRAAVAQ